MRTLIIPCAGKSSRFKTDIPKYLLNHPSGNMMVYESVQGLPMETFDKILLIVLKKHMVNNTENLILDQFKNYKNFELLTLENETSSASDTVSQGIKLKNITGEIYIKDADDYFSIKTINPNQICVFSLDEIENITPGNKSYVRENYNNEVLTIIEKKVISSKFCTGLYSFDSSENFIETFNKLKDFVDGEIYISHVIYKMILNGTVFTTNEVENFIDWGTQKDWDYFKENYKNEK